MISYNNKTLLFTLIFLISFPLAQPFWNTSIYSSDLWYVFNQDTLPNENWNHCNDDNSGWTNMHGGIGYGDYYSSLIDTSLTIFIYNYINK